MLIQRFYGEDGHENLNKQKIDFLVLPSRHSNEVFVAILMFM